MAQKEGKNNNRVGKAVEYVRQGVWTADEQESRYSLVRWLIKQLRVVLYTARGIMTHGSMMRPAALTFYTVMALVPILALVFAILKGFGLESMLQIQFAEQFPQYGTLVEDILTYAEGLIQRTQGGLVAISGIFVLIWAAIRVFNSVENGFNRIWEVKRSRSIGRQAAAYISMIFIIPILIIIFGGISGYIGGFFSDTLIIPKYYIIKIISLLLVWLVFTILYLVVPNTRVRFGSATTAAAVAAVVFVMFQTGYLALQRGVVTYNIIYGSFAAIPLFLIWVQTSWQILLYGAELSFAYQNINSYMQERRMQQISYTSQRKITLAVMMSIVRRFVEGRDAATSEAIAAELHLPVRMIRDVLASLEDARLVAVVSSSKDERQRYFLPAHDVHKLSVYGIIEMVEQVGSDTDERLMMSNEELATASELLDRLHDEALDSEYNLLVIDVLRNEDANCG